MPPQPQASQCTPDTALGELVGFRGRLLVDLDETLYLRNSTEDFIDTARPALFALLLLRCLDLIKPWKWTGGEVTRDVWRVGLVMLLLPWTLFLWRRRVTGLAAMHGNARLIAALRTRALPVTIATVGFGPVIRPLLRAFDLPEVSVVAARVCFADRRTGKLAMVNAVLGHHEVASSMVLTDSPHDRPLLESCAHPLEVIWPEARYVPAFARVYLPTEYLLRVKRPGERYFIRGIVQDDFAFWVLSSVALATHPMYHVCALFLMLLSFWSVYERGYVDNDRVAHAHERHPKLSVAYFENPVPTPMVLPWVWAAGLGALGLFVLRYPQLPGLADGARWSAVLVGTYVWFKFYNRMDKGSRVWLFPVLQLARSAAFMVLVPVSLISVAALSAHLVARWVPYYVYRYGGKEWPSGQPTLIRLAFFVLQALLLASVQGFALLGTPTALALLLWTAFRGRHELAQVLQSAKRIDHPREGK